jgi:hypothetical protein
MLATYICDQHTENRVQISHVFVCNNYIVYY